MTDSDSSQTHDSADAETADITRLELALKASNEGIWDWTSESGEIYYSRRILEFFECGSSEVPKLFEPPFEHIHPDDRSTFESTIAEVFEDGGPETLVVNARILTGSGDWRWLRIRGTVLRDRDGKASRIAGSMIDISRRKDAEAQVEEERFLLRQLINNIPVNVYFKDLESRFVMVNQGMARWTGIGKPAEHVGKHDRDIWDEAHWKPAERDEQQIIETGEPITNLIEEETRRKGETTWVSTSKFPWRGRDGRIKGTFGVSSDVTDLEKARQKATDLASELKQKNEVYEEELALAREMQNALTGSEISNISEGSISLTFDSRYIPSSELAGDFCEVIHIRPDCIGVLIIDVMGHGVRSALVVAMLRGLLEQQRSNADDPGAFLEGLNNGLSGILERAGVTLFATAFYGVFDTDRRSFFWACAGHPGPIIETIENEISQLATERKQKGPGLGLIGGAAFPTNTLAIDRIRRLILFTDGIIEAENQEGEPFEEQRLIRMITDRSDATLEVLLDHIVSSVLNYQGRETFDDDVCMLGIDLEMSES